ncbi:hypothetical protein ALC53_09806 [Atta colombica]|uniref:Uncharacterized protein n=1 Tax=Atta colombica TaxID=520822 RepID=A0A195B5H0_9HYME|nr:hypothetical protein ALC53_09806 [Atta colombica]
MFLATTYGLNKSHTKTIHVGLQTKKSLKLGGRNLFRHRLLAVISRSHGTHERVSSDNRVKSNFVVIKNITISFTTSYRRNQYCCRIKKKRKISTEIFEKKRMLTIQLQRKNKEPT